MIPVDLTDENSKTLIHEKIANNVENLQKARNHIIKALSSLNECKFIHCESGLKSKIANEDNDVVLWKNLEDIKEQVDGSARELFDLIQKIKN